ncbi:hypothetical protein TNCV_5031431 [Trichonephila clavipes]|nr:hypothetical protein TNCV_5031431 [Trichonephila clavipes]
MKMKFEETGDLGVLLGRGWKPVGIETAEDVATTVVEKASSSQSGRSGSCELQILWSKIRKILRYILKWYQYKDPRDANAETSRSQNTPRICLPIFKEQGS